MTNQPTETVIAGSKGFALALLAPLTERVGTRPRIAADPAQALKLTGGSGLVVVEFQGDRSLEAIRQLLDQAAGLAVVAAVPVDHAGAEESLRALGVEPARWDGRPESVLSAVARRLGAEPQPVPVAARPAPAATDPHPARLGVGALFDDIPLDDAPLDEVQPDPLAHAIGQPLAPVPAGSALWPANVPGAVEAADALGRGLGGVIEPPGTTFAVVPDVLAGMSPLERAVLTGEAQAVDTEPIRRAAVMRVRVAVALATAPKEPGAGPADPAAVSALLAEIDELLAEVNALVAGAPPEVGLALEQVRNALVKEAIDFSEAAHHAASVDAPAAEQQPTVEARRAAKTRVVSVTSQAEMEIERLEARRRNRLSVFLAVAAVLAGAFHGYRWWEGRDLGAAPSPTTRAGAPGDAVVVGATTPGAAVIVKSKDGRPFTAEELKRMEGEEALRGNVVRVIGPSAVMVGPGKSAGVPGALPGPAGGR